MIHELRIFKLIIDIKNTDDIFFFFEKFNSLIYLKNVWVLYLRYFKCSYYITAIIYVYLGTTFALNLVTN